MLDGLFRPRAVAIIGATLALLAIYGAKVEPVDDVLRAVAAGTDCASASVEDWMTPDPDFLTPDVDVSDAADWLMATGHGLFFGTILVGLGRAMNAN